MSTGAALSFLAWWQEMAARTECSVDGDASSRVCRQALGRRDWPATGSRNQIRHAHRICRLSLSRGTSPEVDARRPGRPARPDPRVVWATRQGQIPRWSSAIHLSTRSVQFAHGAGLPYSPIWQIAAAHYAQDRKMEIGMITARTCTASLTLVLALAFSPLSGSRAAPLSGPSAQPLATGLTTVAEKEKRSVHHEKRHRRHHVMHGKHHGGCGGANMYYSRKKHRCMDARSK